MFRKISTSVLAAVAITMLILSAVFYWTVSGYILMALSFAWFLLESALSFRKTGLYALVPLAVLLVLGFAVWFPIAFVGLETGLVEAFFVLGAMADAVAIAYIWGR